MTIPRDLQGQMADLYRRIADIERRGRNRRRPGTVAEVDHENGRYRVKLGEQEGAAPYLSGWIKPRVGAGGSVKIDVLLKEGEQVDVVSENGDMTDARIELSDYSDANPRENTDTPLHIKIDGDGAIICGNLKITADVQITGKVDITGDTTVTGSFVASGGDFEHDGKDVGATHKHRDVTPGPALTGDPA